MEQRRERDRTWLVRDPILMFVLDGVKYAVEHTGATWEEVRDTVVASFPDAEIVLDEEQQAE